MGLWSALRRVLAPHRRELPPDPPGLSALHDPVERPASPPPTSNLPPAWWGGQI